MEWKKVIKANCMQLVFVFIAFFLMVEVSYLSVSDIVLQRLDDGVSDVIRAAEMNAELELKELLISLDALAESLRDALERGVPEGSAPSFPDFASAWTQGGVLPLFYGLVRGGAGDYHTLSSSSHIPQGIHEKLAWFLEKEKEAGARSAAPDRRVLYSEPRTNAATGMFVTAARGIYGHSGEFLGVIAVDIDTVWLSGSFFRLRTLEGSYGILLDERMHLIGHPKREFLGFPLWELDAAQGGSRKLYEKLAANNEFTGAAMKSLNGDSVVMSIRRMFNGWYIGTVIPFHVYYRDAHRTAAILSVVGFILAFCLGYVLLRLSAARIRSEEENQSKSTVLATISHEIRTPLNAIIGLSEVELRKELPEETRGNLEKILSSGSNLLAIINDILDISKISAGRLEFLPADFDVPSLINDVVQLNIVRIGSKNIAFDLQIDESMPNKLYGDELRVKQVLNNLLSNAFKYTPEGAVSFIVRCWLNGDEAVIEFIVQDTGIGIKKEHLGKLFKEYSQLNSRPDRNIEGTGLGLSIARKLAELMGGTITVRSQYGKGSCFTAVLRLKVADKTPIGPGTANDLRNFRFSEDRKKNGRRLVIAHTMQGRVLVVDDVATNLDVAKGFMTPYGLTVDCVLSARKAIEIIRAIPDDAPASEKYDIIFMDHMMPDMDGVEATRIIRGNIGTKYARAVPIVALTANALIGSDEMFFQNGFNDFVPKPIDIFRLDAVLKKWMPPGARKHGAPPLPAGPEGTGEPDTLLDGLHADGLDIGAGTADYAGAAVYLTILRSYAHHTPELLETLSSEKRRLEALPSPPSQEEMRKYAVTVHGLKGSSYGIKAGLVAGAAEALERAAKAGDWETVRSGHDKLIQDAEALLARLEELLKTAAERLSESASKEKRPRRAAPDRALLEQLLSAAQRSRTSRMEELMAELESCDYDSGADLVLWLRERIEDIEYEAVAERLKAALSK